ncbi:ribosome biogenesis GTPase Der [Geminicoccaceae bacterium 1502E]|nr:ribosome biogenesis GTPase Der [Geminicoccaceae bacterium 1502E]
MRTVAILGRPNVGKSTLFNRMVGRRQALVHDLPGLTRDRLEGDGRLYDLSFRVVDTAGVEAGGEETLPGRLRQLTFEGLEEADVGLFLIDARAGVTPADQDIAEILRRSDKPVLLVANKCEGRAAIAGAAEAWSLGLGEPVWVSAEHGEGLVDLADMLRPLLAAPELPEEEPPEALALDAQAEDEEEEAGPKRVRLAIVGRPNVGKSSLVNRLIDRQRLLTGPEPGLTRDSVSIVWQFEDREIELIDTAGLRRRTRIEQQVEKLSVSATIRSIRSAHVVVLVMDATMPLEHQDLTIANLAIDEGRALVVVVNKWDLVEDPQAALALLHERLGDRLAQVKGVICVPLSAHTGRGVDKLLPTLFKAYERWRKRVPTAQLNRWLREALEAHPPPLVNKRRIKIRYMTQASSRPPTFALFANRQAENLPGSYLRYLSAGMRDAFDLHGVPLRFVVRHGENPYASE